MPSAHIASEPNATPLIDVLLVLLVILIITLPVATHRVALNLPQAPAHGTAPPPQLLVVGIDFDGALTWNGEPVESIASLEARFRTQADRQPQPTVQFRPDRHGPYERVAQALAAAQRARMMSVGIRHEPY